jgi:protein ImuB
MSTDTPLRTLVVWCPDWPVLAVGADPDEAAAVVEDGRVAACSFAARADGVRRGQKTRDAQRLSPGLTLHPRDFGAEARLFEPVLAVLEEFTPRTEVLRPGLAAFPVEGPARYFASEENRSRPLGDMGIHAEEHLARLLRDRLGDVGIGVGIGVADGVFAATLAARGDLVVPAEAAKDFLARFPTTVLELPDLIGPLSRLGINTLGRLAELPADSIAGRFGAEGVMAHRLAHGLDARPPALRRPGPDLAVATAFEPPADRSERVVFAAKSLADDLHAVLAQAGLACVRVAVELHGVDNGNGVDTDQSDPPVSYRLWRHDGLLSSTAVAERVRWQLSAWQPFTAARSDDATHVDAISAETGISLLRLIPDQLVPAKGVQPGLWGTDEAPDRVARAAERLQAMLGHQAVTIPSHRGGRGPADQTVRTPFGDLPPEPVAKADANAPWPARLPDPAPPGVPTEPRPVSVTDASGNVVIVTGRTEVSASPAILVPEPRAAPLRIVSWAGPWPLSERWWDPEHARRSARFQAVTHDGRAWLLCVQGGQWLAEAVYD